MEYGLVLTGGGARGAYHAGVYKALGELKMNKKITAVTGTSIGAVTAALIAAGNGPVLLDIWHKLSPIEIRGKRHLFRYDTDRVKQILDRIIDEDKVRKSNILFGFEIFSKHELCNKELFIDDIPHGMLTEYLTAAVCLPIFKPVKIKGHKYIDGGMVDNAPVDMLINKGYKNIILSDAHGIGRERRINDSDASIIRIRCERPPGGILDFDMFTINDTSNCGFLDCMREFGEISGRIYAIDTKSYTQSAKKYGKSAIDKLETTAYKLGIATHRLYDIGTLAGVVSIMSQRLHPLDPLAATRQRISPQRTV